MSRLRNVSTIGAIEARGDGYVFRVSFQSFRTNPRWLAFHSRQEAETERSELIRRFPAARVS